MIKFNNIRFEEVRSGILEKRVGDKIIINFLNSNDLYNYKNKPLFRNTFSNNNQTNLIDGFMISLILSIKNLKKISRLRGPTFTRKFLEDKKLNKNKKHFFVGLKPAETAEIAKNTVLKKTDIFCYNPPYTDGIKFSDTEVNKIANKIDKADVDYIWVCVGSPKQNILSAELYDKANFKYCFNVGAALDFKLNKKKEAPKLIQKIGAEWFYRLITDFEHSKKKVWRSVIGSLCIRKQSKIRIK